MKRAIKHVIATVLGLFIGVTLDTVLFVIPTFVVLGSNPSSDNPLLILTEVLGWIVIIAGPIYANHRVNSAYKKKNRDLSVQNPGLNE